METSRIPFLETYFALKKAAVFLLSDINVSHVDRNVFFFTISDLTGGTILVYSNKTLVFREFCLPFSEWGDVMNIC